MKQCIKCKKVRPFKTFSRRSDSKDGYAHICKDCHNKYVRTIWYPKHKERHLLSAKQYKFRNRNQLFATQYGVSVEIINILFTKSDKKCEICKKELPLKIDHDHTTRNIRGLLCHKCNLGIGLFFDDVVLLKSAIKYLEK